jgi:uncharacterized protein (DUF2225 family)
MDRPNLLMMQPVAVNCGLCGALTFQKTAPDIQPSEPPDFDTRPGEPLRSTLPLWMHCCPKCGYCAADISTIHDKAADLVATSAYQAQLRDSAIPAKAREFLCHALILQHVDQHSDAGWSALHAAWQCDDEKSESAAEHCRQSALAFWKAAKSAGQQFGDDLAIEFVIVADLYRRAGDFESAIVTSSDALDAEELPPLFERLLRREKSLAEQKDKQRHSLSELLPSLN